MNIKNTNRYAVSEKEDYEPGSDDQVLKNRLAVKSKVMMDQIEAQELKRTELKVMEIFDENHRFTSGDICEIHRLWLEDIYFFAGQYRTVNMSKGNFIFAVAKYISTCMKKFEQEYLSQYILRANMSMLTNLLMR